jgi:hypothetical protein
MFTIRATKARTDRASVSQAIAHRGDPAASANVARGLQALHEKAKLAGRGG